MSALQIVLIAVLAIGSLAAGYRLGQITTSAWFQKQIGVISWILTNAVNELEEESKERFTEAQVYWARRANQKFPFFKGRVISRKVHSGGHS